MGKATGFMEITRLENPYRAEDARLRDFEDLHVSQPVDARRAQASRCMNCGVPFCQSDFGCPLHNLIPEWNDLLYRGREREALARERRMQDTIIEIKKKYGKNAILRGMNLEEGATAKERNRQIGGHKA